MNKKLVYIMDKLNNINKNSKKIIKIGFIVFIALLISGLIAMCVDFLTIGYNPLCEQIYKGLIGNSFVLLAEFIIGGLVIDYVLDSK